MKQRWRKNMKLAITGATGNMGMAVMEKVLVLPEVSLIRVLIEPNDDRMKRFKKQFKNEIKRNVVEILIGNMDDSNICHRLIHEVEYVINLAAVIPPRSDQDPSACVRCNEKGVHALVSEIEKITVSQPKLIHISTVALYGNRTERHPFAKVGDPLLVSPFDIYAATKLRGEFRVLESHISSWVVLRQTAMIHKNMLKDNMSDGLMFHTPMNAPLEWVSAEDSGTLIAHILKEDHLNHLDHTFWKKVFNIGSLEENCISGYETINEGFQIIGGSVEKFFSPQDCCTRNFHGVWFSDGQLLNEKFHYQEQSISDYWNTISKNHRMYRLGRFVPTKLINHFFFNRLRKNKNAPSYWYHHQKEAKIIAYYGSVEQYEKLNIPWEEFTFTLKNISKEEKKKEKSFFEINKEDKEITLDDLKQYASYHGGRLVTPSFVKGDVYRPLTWETQDHEQFVASAYTVIRAGHWYHPIYKENVWDFNRLSKKDKIFAYYWYDSHHENEEDVYRMNEQYEAVIEK